MNQIENIYFIGANYRIAQILDRLYPLKQIYCEKRSFNLDIYNFAKLYSIKFDIVQTRNDLELILPKEQANSVGISHGTGIIFKKNHINAFTHGIWNIHYGGLPENRGRHPISWDYLNGCKKFGVSIHAVNEEIDQGHLLAKDHVNRDLHDTQKAVEDKMIKLLESGLMQVAFENYFSGNIVKLHKGVYNKSLANEFAVVSPEEFNSIFLFNLFKSQAKYGGIKVRGKQYIDCVFHHEEFPELFKGYDIFVCKDGEKIGLC